MELIELKCYPILNGIMAWWSSVKEATQYLVTLYINDDPISEKIVERTEKYCSFTGLAAIDGTTQGAASSICLAASNVHVRGVSPIAGLIITSKYKQKTETVN